MFNPSQVALGILTIMKKSNYKTVIKIIKYINNETILMSKLEQLAEGSLVWDDESGAIKNVEVVLTKPQQLAKEMKDAAVVAVDQILGDGTKQMSIKAIIKAAFLRNQVIAITHPKLFRREILTAIDNRDKALGADFKRVDSIGEINEANLNPVMREFAEKNGLTITPLPTQVI